MWLLAYMLFMGFVATVIHCDKKYPALSAYRIYSYRLASRLRRRWEPRAPTYTITIYMHIVATDLTSK